MRPHGFGGPRQWAGGRWDATWEAGNDSQHVIVGIKYGLIRGGHGSFLATRGEGEGGDGE